MHYQNPILPGFHPDPSICRVGGDYYMVTSTFEFFPGVPIYHSTDMVNWEPIGHCLTRQSQLDLTGAKASEGIWAPTLRYHNGIFYMITTVHRDYTNFFVTATDPRGPWSDPVVVRHGGIDPSLFFDDDGKVYYLSNDWHITGGRQGIYMAEVDVATGALLTPFTLLSYGTGGLAVEGPHLYKRDGWYYAMFAEGGTHYGHMETIFRSKNVWGPYEPCPHNPIITHRNKPHEIQGTGHADLFEDKNGDWWLVFLAFRITGGNWHHLGRETFLCPVEWVDGWPVVNEGRGVELDMESPRITAVQHTDLSFCDTFDEPSLGVRYNFSHNPVPEQYSLSARPGYLTLSPDGVCLSDDASPAFTGVRQQHFDCEVRAEMEYTPQAEGDEAGVCVLRNSDVHYCLSVCWRPEGSVVALRRKMGDLDVVVWEQPFAGGRVTLAIRAQKHQYHFGFGTAEQPLTYGPTALTRYVAAETCSGPFTGVYLGMYAQGHTPAAFDSFCYRHGENLK